MEFATNEPYGLTPPGWGWFALGFLVAAVVVARLRPGWLPRFWLGTLLLAVVGTLLWLDRRYLRHEPFHTVAVLVLIHGLPAGVATLWLARTRRHRILSHAAVRLAGALAAFVAGLLIVVMLEPLVG